MSTNKIFIISLDNKFREEERKIKATVAKILKILNKKNVSVEIYLAGSAVMRSLNKKLRGKDKIANVLSFEEPEKFISPKLKLKRMGEIYLNMQKEDENFSREFLLLHGILHLFGYDHVKEADAVKMEAKEKSVISKF